MHSPLPRPVTVFAHNLQGSAAIWPIAALSSVDRAAGSGLSMPDASSLIGIFKTDFANAEKLQAAARGRLARSEIGRMHEASRVLVAALRGKRARGELSKQHSAAATIQGRLRSKNAVYEEDRTAQREKFRVDAKQCASSFIVALDNGDIEKLRSLITSNATLIVSLAGVATSYRGLRAFLEKSPQASRKQMRNVSFETAPLHTMKECFHFQHGSSTMEAEITFRREIDIGRRVATSEYVVRSSSPLSDESNATRPVNSAQDGGPHSVGASAALRPPCVVCIQRTHYRKDEEALTSRAASNHGPNPNAAHAGAMTHAHSSPVLGTAFGMNVGALVDAAATLNSINSVEAPPIPPTEPVARSYSYSHHSSLAGTRQAARLSIRTSPDAIAEACDAAAELWSPQPAGGTDHTRVHTERGATRHSTDRGNHRLPLLSHVPSLPLFPEPHEQRMLARDQRALGRFLARQLDGRSGQGWSMEPIFRNKYNPQLRLGTGLRLEPANPTTWGVGAL